MKKFLFISLVILFVLIGETKAATKKTVVCEYKKGSTCYIGSIKCIDAKKGSENVVTLNGDVVDPLPSGYSELSYFFIPDDSDNPNGSGYGVVDGVIQYDSNNSFAPVYTFELSNSIVFNNHSDWQSFLLQRGITVQ